MGVTGWGIFAIVGLSLGYFGYRYNLPLTIRSGLYPLLKERINGPIGHAVDIFAIVGTMFGIATSLGLGVMQMNSGLNYVFGVPRSTFVQVIIIFAVMAIASVSVLAGLDKGVRRLSELNLSMALVLLLFVLVLGPTFYLIQALLQNNAMYLDDLFPRTLETFAYETSEITRTWFEDWTLFYWAWWISWSPFVGMFLARISRGRTIREFVIGVMIVPSVLSILWFSIFGGAALDLELQGRSIYGDGDSTLQLFALFGELPFTTILSFVAIILISIFFITGADSASIVMAGMSENGAEEPKRWLVVLWGGLTAAVAILMLLPGLREGEPETALNSLQNLTIIAASPFVLVLGALCVAIVKALTSDPFITEKVYLLPRSERRRRDKRLLRADREAAAPTAAPAAAADPGAASAGSGAAPAAGGTSTSGDGSTTT